jgi:hypothetical protein
LVSADDLAKFFDIEPRGERGRTDEVAKHHRELPTLRGAASILNRRRRFRRSRSGPSCGGAQRSDRAENLTSMPDEINAEFPEVFCRQLPEDFPIYCVVFKRRRVLLEAQSAKPV